MYDPIKRKEKEKAAAIEAVDLAIWESAEADHTWGECLDAAKLEYGALTGQSDREEVGDIKVEKSDAATLILAASNIALTAEVRRLRWHFEDRCAAA